MNKEELSEEVKRLQTILNEKKSNQQNILYLDDIFEKIEQNFSELYSLIDDYRNLSYPNLFEGKKNLTEDEEDNNITVMNKCKSDKPDMFNDVPIPAKTVVQLVKSRRYNIKFENFGNPTIIEGLWAIKDAVGFPYVKH